MKVAILGCGPAGLMAAHAATLRGHEVEIYSLKRKSEMFGAMYLHQPIPGINLVADPPEFYVDVVKVGTREGYAKNVYGDPNAPCSWDEIDPGPTPAWDLRGAYDELWSRYESLIKHVEIFPDFPEMIETDKIISSIPAKQLCFRGEHKFEEQPIWVLVDPQPSAAHIASGPMMYYNGYPSDGSGEFIGPDWYRFSLVNSISCWEHSHDIEDQSSAMLFRSRYIAKGLKPLSNTCNCWPEIMRVGRFGKWTKGILTHHAFYEVHDALQ